VERHQTLAETKGSPLEKGKWCSRSGMKDSTEMMVTISLNDRAGGSALPCEVQAAQWPEEFINSYFKTLFLHETFVPENLQNILRLDSISAALVPNVQFCTK
jgi:hypothetical protein